MTQEIINVGTAPDDGSGDPIRTAFTKTNSNFTQLYNRVQNPPATPYGQLGDQVGMYAVSSIYFYYCFANYDGSNVIWGEVSQAGNISATSLIFGNSNVVISGPGSNVNIGVHGVSNVAVFNANGMIVSGTTSVTGNIYSGNTITGASMSTTGNIVAAGNVQGGNLITLGQASVTGNVTANYYFGNGSQLTGLPATYSNANVAAFLPTYTGNLSANNVTANYYFGNGSQLTGLPATYSNANVAAFLPTYTGNLLGGNLTITNNANVQGNVTVAGTIHGNLTGTTSGIHNGLVYSINIQDLSWDFGYIAANTYTNPMQYLFAVTSAGNIDMGNITNPSSLNIDIGTLNY